MIRKRKPPEAAAQSERVADLLAEVNQLRALVAEILGVRRPTAAQRADWRDRAGLAEDMPA